MSRQRRRPDDEQPLLWNAPNPPDAPQTGPAPAGPAPTLTVPQVAERLQLLLAQEFPEPFWLTGEAAELGRARRSPSGHWYFRLVDDQGADDARRATVNVTLWRTTVARLFGPRGRLAGRLQPEDGLVLRVLVRPEFYAPRGTLSFIIEDVDPEFTLGNLDLQRRQVLARLTAEGALQWNKDVPLPDVPLRLGLITALDSAAHNDVMQGLLASGIGFSVLCCDARMQGEQTSRTVRAALRTLVARSPDCILIVRGGGSRLDLSWFDREDIARAIAACPVPVLTGIGHEIDLSVADAVAHRSFKTPTAVAEFVVQHALEARRGTEESFAAIAAQARGQLADAQAALLAAAGEVRRAAGARLARESDGLLLCCQRVRGALDRRLASAREVLGQLRSRLLAGSFAARLAVHSARIAADGERLGRAAQSRLDRQADALGAAGDRARLLDPQRVLGRGFAWLRRADGRSLKDAAAAVTGEALTALLRDGELDLRAGASRPAPPGRTAAPPRPASPPLAVPPDAGRTGRS